MGPRRFDIDYEKFEGLTFETAGAFLAGTDAVQMASPVTRELTERALDLLLATSQLADRFADGETRRNLVLAYQIGLKTGV